MGRLASHPSRPTQAADERWCCAVSCGSGSKRAARFAPHALQCRFCFVLTGPVEACDPLQEQATHPQHHHNCTGLVVAVILAVLLTAYRFADREHLNALVTWVDAHRTKGAVALVSVHIACTGE